LTRDISDVNDNAVHNKYIREEIYKCRALLLDSGADPDVSGNGLLNLLDSSPTLVSGMINSPLMFCYLSLTHYSDFGKETLQDVLSRSRLFLNRRNVTKILHDMIRSRKWDLDHPNRCIQEVLRYDPYLEQLDEHGRTLLQIAFAWSEESYPDNLGRNEYTQIMSAEHLEETLVALIPAGANLRSIDYHGETITETANRQELCDVWEEVLTFFGHDAKKIISDDLRVGLTYRSKDGTEIRGTRLPNHDPKFICKGCTAEESQWYEYFGDHLRPVYSEEFESLPQCEKRPCEQYYNRILGRDYEETEEDEEYRKLLYAWDFDETPRNNSRSPPYG
jgi:hypothetical protein